VRVVGYLKRNTLSSQRTLELFGYYPVPS